MIVVDTNVTSELMRPSPSPSVVAWIRGRPAAQLYTTSITVAEVLYGIARLPASRRKERLGRVAIAVFAEFADRMLAFDEPAAAQYADIVLAREAAGAPISGFDAQIAAICRARGASLATRDTQGFRETDVVVVNP